MVTQVRTGLFIISVVVITTASVHTQQLKLTTNEYFTSPGWDVLVFNNWYDGLFSDAKISGIEFIHHDRRTVTNGDVRLQPTPEQWDPTPQFLSKNVDTVKQEIQVNLHYQQYNFQYSIIVQAEEQGIRISIELQQPLPDELEGKAGFNLEFLPSAYFEKSYAMDSTWGIFPLHPISNHALVTGNHQVQPIARGKVFVASPEDPMCNVEIRSCRGELLLYDGRVVAQNGWFVLRSLIPSNKTGIVVEWRVRASTVQNWKREPKVLYSQVGYHPIQMKKAILEYDSQDSCTIDSLYVVRIEKNGSKYRYKSYLPKPWGRYLRYFYAVADFTDIQEEGIYCFEHRGKLTPVFRISKNVYDEIWHPTMDVFFPVQMDHMLVREAYRVWHGVSHLDDALQAPPNHVHFDLYAQGPTLDSPFQPFEHIPGLNRGGWYDAGDFDIRTQSQYLVVQTLSHVWEDFKPLRDETTILQQERYVEIHKPDGVPDLLQQIEHGVIALVAQYRVFGHAIPGIVDGSLRTYTHIGDGASQTDNKIYSPRLKQYEIIGDSSGTFDDRWAFTTHTTALNYGSSAALAAASRALRGYNDELAPECLSIARKVWDEENKSAPRLFRHGNTTGGDVTVEEFKAAVELFVSTNEIHYRKRAEDIIQERDSLLPQIIPYASRMFNAFSSSIKNKILSYAKKHAQMSEKINNPFGVPITMTGWAGNSQIIQFGITNYYLHKHFPDIITKDDVFKGLQYIFGCHPGSSISFVSSVGTVSKKVAYGSNRADFLFIPGGVVPGVLIIKPDYPENKEDWPFFWGENEYVINIASQYVYLACAARSLLP